MISRIITCVIDPAKMEEFRTELNGQFLPRIQQQQGFVDNLESLDPATGQFCCTTLWESTADEQSYGNGLFQEIAGKLAPLMQGPPTVKTLPVENSSAHRVESGKVAA